MDPTFLQLLTQVRRQEIIRTKGHPKYPKVPVPQFPKLREIQYRNRLLAIADTLAKISKTWAKTEYQNALVRYAADSSDLIQDEDVHSIVLGLTVPLERAQTAMDLEVGGTFEQSAYGTADAVNTLVAKRFAMERKIALGMVYDPVEPWVQGALGEWAETNRKLVKSMVGEQLNRLEQMAINAVTKGERPEQLTLDILKANKVTYNKARLLARDQIGKLTAALTEKRSTAIGLNTYTWETAMDERVRGNPGGKYPSARPSHWGAQGKVGVYGKPGIWLENGKEVPRGPNDPQQGVGFDVQCRCCAGSRWEDLMKPIDESLLEDPYVLAEMGKGPWPE